MATGHRADPSPAVFIHGVLAFGIACMGFALASPASSQSFFQSTSGPGGGSVLSLVRQPDGDLFAAMAHGPIYRSTNDGWWWQPLQRSTTKLATVSNGDLYDLSGAVARSRDDGASWTPLALPRSSTAVLLASGRLLAGTEQGVYRSDDDGATWQPSGLPNANVKKLLIGPEGQVYGAAGKDLVISEDAGDHWSVLATLQNVITALALRAGGGLWVGTSGVYYPADAWGGLYRYVGSGPPELMSRFHISVTAMAERSDGRLFVAESGYCGQEEPGGLWSTSDGTQWSVDAWAEISAIVPGKANEIFLATAGGCGRGSTDGQGVLWSDGLTPGLSSRSRGLVHATSAVLAAAGGIVYAQGDYSLYWSADHGISWYSAGSLGTTAYHIDIAADPAGDVFATSRWISKPAQTGRNPRVSEFGYFVRTRDRGATWKALQAPGVDGIENGVAVTARGSVLILTENGVSRSTDRGDSWPSPNGANLQRGRSMLAPGPISRVFATGGDGVYLSEDDGVSFARIGGLPRRLGVIAAARDERSVYFSTDSGVGGLTETPPGVWVEAPLPTFPGPPNALITDFEGTVYASYSSAYQSPPLIQGVWRLRSGATAWEKIDETPVADFALDDSGYLYAGTSASGVLRSRMPLRAPTDALPHEFGIMTWYVGPSPFAGSTAFALELGGQQRVSLDVFDVCGRVVSRLWKGSDLPAGRNVAVWQPDPRLPSGAYFYRLAAGTLVRSGRVMLIR